MNFYLNRLLAAFAIVALLASFTGCPPRPPSQAEQRAYGAGEDVVAVPATLVYAKKRVMEIVEEFESATAVLNLEQEQQAGLNRTLAEFQDTMFALYEKNTPLVIEYNRQLADILKIINNKSRRQAKKLFAEGAGKEVLDFRQQESRLKKSYTTTLEEMIPADKREQWQAHCITRKILELAKPMEFTDDQISELKQLAPQALARVKKREQRFWKIEGALELEKLFERTVLTGEQANEFIAIKMEKRRLNKK